MDSSTNLNPFAKVKMSQRNMEIRQKKLRISDDDDEIEYKDESKLEIPEKKKNTYGYGDGQ